MSHQPQQLVSCDQIAIRPGVVVSPGRQSFRPRSDDAVNDDIRFSSCIQAFKYDHIANLNASQGCWLYGQIVARVKGTAHAAAPVEPDAAFFFGFDNRCL
jgi:hypothetical protein